VGLLFVAISVHLRLLSDERSEELLIKDWFWRPPRAHGETLVDRRVSPLELLYDLVYVTVIAQAGNHLVANLSTNGLFEFAVVFSLTWIAWANGSLYLELHGRLDGRTRTYVFLQIGILAILAVYAAVGWLVLIALKVVDALRDRKPRVA